MPAVILILFAMTLLVLAGLALVSYVTTGTVMFQPRALAAPVTLADRQQEVQRPQDEASFARGEQPEHVAVSLDNESF